jgi:hypothetical protein
MKSGPVRYVEFSARAEQQRTDLPLRIRREISRAIVDIATRPEWGAPTSGAMPRLLNPGHGPNSGLMAQLVTVDGQSPSVYAIVYRLRSADDSVSIEDIRAVFIG